MKNTQNTDAAATDAQTDAEIKAAQDKAAKRAAARAEKPKDARKSANGKAGAAIKNAGKPVKALADKAKDKAAANAKVEASLDRTAHEINVRFEKAAELGVKADDHRLAAALLLEEARAKLEPTGVKFKDWVAKNVKQSWETVRKLVVIGAAKDPKQALLETREKNKAANKAHRAAKKAEPAKKAIAAPKVDPIAQVRSLKPADQAHVVKKIAADLGLVVQTEAEHATLKQASKVPAATKEAPAPKAEAVIPSLDYNAIVAGFNSLRPSEQLRFVRFAAGVCKVELAGVPKEAGQDTEEEDIPPMLDRRPRRA